MSKGKLEEIFFSQKAIKELMADEKESIIGRAIAILENVKTGKKRIIHGINIVTDDGDTYYAQMAASETPDDDFVGGTSGIRLGDDNTPPTKADIDVTSFLSGTNKAIEATYPQTDDQDADNIGAGVDIISWLYSYTTAQGNAVGIYEGGISDVHAGASTALLTHFLFAAAFDKTSSDTLKIFVNHEFDGI